DFGLEDVPDASPLHSMNRCVERFIVKLRAAANSAAFKGDVSALGTARAALADIIH
ncbi:hypothetical protein EVAR_70786_1, partial [Eumeta japonica]